jgi:hypothetical protein
MGTASWFFGSATKALECASGDKEGEGESKCRSGGPEAGLIAEETMAIFRTAVIVAARIVAQARRRYWCRMLYDSWWLRGSVQRPG